jgi:hypothetical protein
VARRRAGDKPVFAASRFDRTPGRRRQHAGASFAGKRNAMIRCDGGALRRQRRAGPRRSGGIARRRAPWAARQDGPIPSFGREGETGRHR